MRVPSENEKSRLATVFRRVPLIALVQRKVKTFNQSRRSERDRKQWRNRWTNPGSVVPQHRHPLKKYLVAWVLLLFAVGLFIAGFSLTDRSDMKAYLTDSLVQGSGVFAALTLAWIFFERHNQHEADRVFVGVRSRIVVIRNFACVSIMYLTSELFDVPPRKAEGYDPGYFSGHYGELRQTLGVGTGGSFNRLGVGTGGSFNRLPEGFERNKDLSGCLRSSSRLQGDVNELKTRTLLRWIDTLSFSMLWTDCKMELRESGARGELSLRVEMKESRNFMIGVVATTVTAKTFVNLRSPTNYPQMQSLTCWQLPPQACHLSQQSHTYCGIGKIFQTRTISPWTTR